MNLLIKTLVLSMFATTFMFASTAQLFESLGYSSTYEKALIKAKKSNKLLMLVVGEVTCPWCRKLENQVLKKENINKEVQKNFVAVGLEKNIDKYPAKFTPQVVPTVVFVNPKDESVIFNSYGYVAKKEFLKLLNEVVIESKKVVK